MRVCFLDIDGVLNYADYGEDTYYDKYGAEKVALDPECVSRLKTLLETFPDLKIVWSTSWRNFKGECWNGFQNPLKYLEDNHPWLKERIIGKTPMKMSSQRWHEVKWWLDRNETKLDGYVVLDDIAFPKDWFGIENHVVLCELNTGFTQKNLEEAIEILK